MAVNYLSVKRDIGRSEVRREVREFTVTINALAPGMVSTRGLREEEFAFTEQDDYESLALNDIPSHRFAEPDEIAAIILFLCSPAARFVNGAALVADGGQYVGAWTDWFDPEVP